jgi:Tfp pilus assembly protein PilF
MAPLKTRTISRDHIIGLLLFLITVAVYWSVSRCDFVNFDDSRYITYNPTVQQGLTAANLTWVWSAVVAANWHPVTILSHMLDCSLFGLHAGPHHLVNLLFHIANTLLLFGILRRMTGESWPAALVAALFAVHPLHVESVAWVSERKDVLSTFFGMLTILAYSRYVTERAKGTPGQLAGGSRSAALHYILALLFFALALMSKPMLVTWPLVLLLLDFWPLGRIQFPRLRGAGSTAASPQGSNLRLIWEKAPFFALATACSAITMQVQQDAGLVVPLDYFTVSERVGNALVSYFRYIAKTLWPNHLAVFYPYPTYPHPRWPALLVVVSTAVLVLITLGAVRQIRQRPFLIFGWLWFLLTLVPVIGLVQVGHQTMADRYAYIPQIGLFVMVAWGLKDFCSARPVARPGVCAVAVAALAALCVVSSLQLRYWRNSEALFRHALDVTANNPLAQTDLADALLQQGRFDEALAHVKEARRLAPNVILIRMKLQEVLIRQGNTRELIELYRETLRSSPDQPGVLNNLAWTLATAADAQFRNGPEAVQLAEQACNLTDYSQPVYVGTLAAAYAEAGRYDAAVRTAERACASAEAAGVKPLLERNRQLLERYRKGQPYHEQRN